MSFQTMAFALAGEIPGLPFPLAQTKIQEALGNIYDDQLWSFQLAESGWLTPGLLFPTGTSGLGPSSGTITTTAYSNQIVGNATAAAAWLAYSLAGTMPLLTQLQIRSPYYSLYNIVAYDGVNTFTIDRLWMEPAGAGQSYMVYQSAFAAPVSDFKRFFELRDTTNAAPLDYWTYSRRDLAIIDPERTIFNIPSYVVPYETDKRAGSSTSGYMLFELWPHPLSILPYTMSYLRRGPSLTLPSDTIPSPLTEELVMWRAREVSYLWKESQKGDDMKRGSGADWHFLAQAAAVEYQKRWKKISDLDRDLCELYWSRFTRNLNGFGEPFATMNNGLNIGRW